MKRTLDELADTARLWVFTLDQPLQATRKAPLLAALDGFLHAWTSHGRTVEGAATLFEDRFLLIGAQIPGGDISGCGTDALFHAVEEALAEGGTHLAPPLTLAYRSPAGLICTAERGEIRTLIQTGDLASTTPVFDLALGTVGGLRSGHFERPAEETWLRRYLAPLARVGAS